MTNLKTEAKFFLRCANSDVARLKLGTTCVHAQYRYMSVSLAYARTSRAILAKTRVLYLALINRAGGLYTRPRSRFSQDSDRGREVCTHDRGQDSPIQTDLARLIRCNWFADILQANADELQIQIQNQSNP